MAEPGKPTGDPLLTAAEKAVQVLREGERTPSAVMLQGVLDAAYVSRSEMAGEIGLALRRILIIEGKRLPDTAVKSMNQALDEVERVWPEIRHVWMNL